MNIRRTITLAAIFILPMVLFPPWELVGVEPRFVQYVGYWPVWSPPQTGAAFNPSHPRLVIPQLVLQVVGAILFSILLTQIPWSKRITLGGGAR